MKRTPRLVFNAAIHFLLVYYRRCRSIDPPLLVVFLVTYQNNGLLARFFRLLRAERVEWGLALGPLAFTLSHQAARQFGNVRSYPGRAARVLRCVKLSREEWQSEMG